VSYRRECVRGDGERQPSGRAEGSTLIGLSDALWADVIAARHPCDLVRLPVTRLTGAARS